MFERLRRRRREEDHGKDNAESTDFCASQIGELLEEQGRCLDEANANLDTVTKENAVLRERLSCAVSSSSKQSRFPLRNTTNRQPDRSKLLVEENRLLTEQATILSTELRDANRALAEREKNMASLGKSLAVCVEKSRKLLEEKSTLEGALLVKTKEVEGSLANESRLNSIITVLEANAKSSLEEREEVMKDAESHAQMAANLTRSLKEAQSSLASKQAEVENLSMELETSKRDTESALQEKEMSSEAATSLRRSLSSFTARNEKLEREVSRLTSELEDSDIAQHSLQISRDHMQAEMQVGRLHLSQFSNARSHAHIRVICFSTSRRLSSATRHASASGRILRTRHSGN